MRAKLSLFLSFAFPLAAGCGGGNADGSGGSGGASATTAAASMTTTGASMTTTGASMTTGGAVPDPGTTDKVDMDFTDAEPNDSPSQATPLGIAAGPNLNVWVTNNTIGATDAADYFVFKSNATAGNFSFDVCFASPVTAMTATLWKVSGGAQVMPPVGTWMSTGTCVTNMGMTTPLDASTEYLLGLTATGGSGTYGA